MKPKTKTLPSLRITDDTDSTMQMAIKKLNEKSIVPVTLQEYRRICYYMTSKLILEGKELPKITQS
jgi:hypothetical protein